MKVCIGGAALFQAPVRHEPRSRTLSLSNLSMSMKAYKNTLKNIEKGFLPAGKFGCVNWVWLSVEEAQKVFLKYFQSSL